MHSDFSVLRRDRDYSLPENANQGNEGWGVMSKVTAAMLVVMFAISPSFAAEYWSEGWEGYLSKDKTTGAPKSCSIYKGTGSGESIGIVLRLNRRIGSGAIELIIAADSRSWETTEGQTYSSRTWIDGEFHSAGGVVATESIGVLGLETYKRKTLLALRDAREITVRVLGTKVDFSMDGSASAVDWLQACAENNIIRALRSDEPPGKPMNPEEMEYLGLDEMDGILMAAGLTGYTMVPGEELDDPDTSEWLWGQGGGRQYYDGKTGGNFDAVFADTIANIKNMCVKTKPSGFRDWTDAFSNGASFGKSDFYCVDGRGESRTAITVIEGQARNLVVILYGAVASDVREADDRLTAVFRELYR